MPDGHPHSFCPRYLSLPGLLTLLALAGPPGAHAQGEAEGLLPDPSKPLSLEDCVAIALRANPSHQKVRGTVSASRAAVLEAYGGFLPRASFGYSLSDVDFFNPTFVNPEGTVSSFPLTIPADTTFPIVADSATGFLRYGDPVVTPPLTIPVPEGGRRFSGGQVRLSEQLSLGGANWFALRRARAEERADEMAIDASAASLRYTVSQAYFQILARERLLELAQEVLGHRAEQLRLAQARLAVGSVTKLDVLQAEIDKGTQQNQVRAAEQELAVGHMELNRLLGIDLDASYPLVDDTTLFEPTYALEELVAEARARRPDLLQLREQAAAASEALRAERAGYLPSLGVDLTFSRSEQGGLNSPFTFRPRNEATILDVGLSWEFFSGFSTLSRDRAAAVTHQNLRHDIRDKDLQVEKEVKNALLTLERIYQQSLITAKNRELGRQTLALEKERYRLGSSSLLDLRSAQVTFIQAETDHINKVFEFQTSLAALELATGKGLR